MATHSAFGWRERCGRCQPWLHQPAPHTAMRAGGLVFCFLEGGMLVNANWCMVVLERPDRLLLLHQLDPSGPAAGYNPVHVFSLPISEPPPRCPRPRVLMCLVWWLMWLMWRLPGCLVALAAHPPVRR